MKTIMIAILGIHNTMIIAIGLLLLITKNKLRFHYAFVLLGDLIAKLVVET